METRFTRWQFVSLTACALATFLAPLARAASQASAAAQQRFAQLDADRDDKLSLTEFIQAFPAARAKDGQRQFAMFDRNADEVLSLAEFRNVAGLLADKDRGPLADPLVDRAAAAFAACEKQWGDWDRNGDGALDELEFDAAEVNHFLPGLDRSRFAHWDRNGDGRLDRDETRQSLDVAFGVRRPQGELLRLADGRAVSWLGFKHIDSDNNDTLSLDECEQHGFDGPQTASRFKEMDADGDGQLSFAEWAAAPSRSIGCTWQFLTLDKNFDALLDEQELLGNPLPWQFPLTRFVLRAFDDNHDGKLNFYEFLGTPLVCLQQKWHVAQVDANHDGRLDFDEFREPRDLADPLDAAALAADYFRRFDLNRDGSLDFQEFFYDSDAVPVEMRLQAWDVDGNGRLNEQEFVAGAGLNQAAGKRDFALFDGNRDGLMDAAELAVVPKFAGPKGNGRVFDPLQVLADRYGVLIEKHWRRWNANGNGMLSTGEFRDGMAEAFGTPTTLNGRQFDADEDGSISMAEARAAVQVLVGVRSAAGVPLRELDGRVCDVNKFRDLDRNRDALLSRTEITASAGFPASQLHEFLPAFARADLDQNGQLSLDEWRRLPHLGCVDPTSEFRFLDANFDGRLDRDELLERVPRWKRKLAQFILPGFDFDRDGTLSLAEYRFTPLANPLAKWFSERTDADGNQRLSVAEFLDSETEFPLLARQYFQCFDLDGSGELDSQEYFFKTFQRNAFYLLNADGTGWRKLFQSENYAGIGSPAVSPDGKTIAFDAWKIGPSRRQRGMQKIFFVDINGASPREICHGLMPNWSPDGRSFVCSRDIPTSGTWIVSSDGQVEKYIHSAWGGQWSPDGKQIVFYHGAEIMLYDVTGHQLRRLFAGAENPYGQVYWNMAWSPDSKRICFRGVRPDGSDEVALLAVDGAQPKFRVRYRGKNLCADFAWHPSQDRIVFGMHDAERNRLQLYELNPNNDNPPQWFPGQDPERPNSAACWTPDGQRLIVVSGDY